jgi:cytochrome P450
MSELTLPGPRPWPVLGTNGNLLSFVRDPLSYVERLFREHGPVAALVRGRSRRIASPGRDTPAIIFVHGPELNRALFSDSQSFRKSPLSGPLYPEHGATERTRPLLRMMTGLFNVNGEVHRDRRRLMLPAFHKSRLDHYRDDMAALTDSVATRIEPGTVRNLRDDFTELTLRIATKTLFGADMGESGLQISRSLAQWLQLFQASVALPYDLPGLPYRRFLDLSGSIVADLGEMIEGKRKLGSGADVLSMLIEARDENGAPLSDDELIGHAGVIFAAGHETTANSLCWTLFLISQHPQVATDLTDELASVLRGDAPRVDQLGSLPLLDRVIKESLRLLPPAPMNHRVVSQACELGGFDIPSGCEAISSAYHTHRQPDLFPEPHRFRPSRWEGFDPGPYAFSPFGAGARMCIGSAFAMMELKIVLAILLQRFRFELDQDRKLERAISIVMGPKPGLYMRVHRSDQAFTAPSGPRRGNVWDMVALD